VVLVSANQTGAMGEMRFLGQAKVVGPGGSILARTWGRAGLAVAELDVAEQIGTARRVLRHLDERRPAAYRAGTGGPVVPAPRTPPVAPSAPAAP
jgi:nitrilase